MSNSPLLDKVIVIRLDALYELSKDGTGDNLEKIAIKKALGVPCKEWLRSYENRESELIRNINTQTRDEICTRAFEEIQENQWAEFSCIKKDDDIVEPYVRITTKGKQYVEKYRIKSKNIFIAHGHDEAKWRELKSIIIDLKLNPIVLEEQNDNGMAIIEKFEHYASECSFAFILLTPDDKQEVQNSREEQWRARQNVILEMGWFMAKLGRQKVVLLHKGTIETPTDLSGIIYYKFLDKVSERYLEISKSLTAAGVL